MRKIRLIKFLKSIFKKNKQIQPKEPRREQFTKCDNCEELKNCIIANNVINVTTLDDMYPHHVCGIGCNCKKQDKQD